MTTGYIAPLFNTAEKTSQQSFVYHNARWAFQCRDNIYLEMPVATDGVQEGWGDGTTQNAIKKADSGFSGKVNEVGFDYNNDEWQVFSRSSVGGGIRYHSSPYTIGTDSYGATSTTRLDNSGDNWNSSGFDAGKCAFVTDQQGNPLFFALGSSADGGTLAPKDGLLCGYDPLGVGQPHVQVDSGFNRTASTNTDAFLFNDGTDDYVGVVYSGGGNFKLAYHKTESDKSNYATGWVVESAGIPAGDSTDDHVCARAYDGSLYAVVKGGNGSNGYLLTSTGGIDTLTNNTSFLFTEFQDNMSRPVICIDETAEEMHIFYEQYAITQSTINTKVQPLVGFSFTSSDIGTVFIENGTDDMENPTPPSHNVTASMGFIPITCENNTANNTWHNRVDVSASSGITVTGLTGEYNYSGITGEIDLTGEVVVTAQTGNYNYSGVDGEIALGAEIIVTGETGAYSYTGVSGEIELTGLVTVEGATANYNYSAIDGEVILQGSIIISGDTANYDYNAIDGTISLQGILIPNYKYVTRVNAKLSGTRVSAKSNITRVK